MASDAEDSKKTGDQCRAMIRSAERAALAVALPPAESAGDDPPDTAMWPYASLVLVAADHDGAPVLLLSSLAEHSRALAADRRCALLFDGTADLANPLEGARLTVLGTAEPSDDPALRARYLARHPSAAQYVDFRDFSFYRVVPARAHLVAGFGQIVWVDGTALVLPGAAAGDLREAEPRIVEHMNADHGDALDAYARHLLGLAGEGWRMSGIDPEGVDMTCDGLHARLGFESPVLDATAARMALVALAEKAQKIARSGSARGGA